MFTTLPIAFSEMPGGVVFAPVFFLLLSFAALTSSISLLEVATAYFIDERGWSRVKATFVTGGLITVLGIPSAIAASSALFGDGFASFSSLFYAGEGKNWFETFVDLTFNLMLPLGGMGIALFVGWRVGNVAREQGFKTGTRLGKLYWGWVQLLRYVVPLAVLLVIMNALGVFN